MKNDKLSREIAWAAMSAALDFAALNSSLVEDVWLRLRFASEKNLSSWPHDAYETIYLPTAKQALAAHRALQCRLHALSVSA